MEIETLRRRMNEASLRFYVWATYKKPQKPKQKSYAIKVPNSAATLCLVVALVLLVFPTLAFAQGSGVGSALSGITDILKQVVNVFILEWGYYLGIIALAVQGIRWKMGQISVMQLGGWALGVCLVFFAPNIVKGIKDSSGASAIQ